jgi:hypothetical protein
MNLNVQQTYLGWRALGHAPSCARPTWTKWTAARHDDEDGKA